jgi:hypothetical protein
MPIHLIDIEKSLGGRSNHGTFHNTHHVLTDLDYNDPGMRTIAQKLVEAEQVVHHEDVYFMNVHIKQVAENTINRPDPDEFVTMELDVKGLRVSAAPPLPGEVCLLVKREAVNGRAGRLLYRYSLSKEDVNVNNNNQFEIADRNNFEIGGLGADSIIEKLNAGVPGGQLCLPNKAGLVVQTARLITGHRLGGVSLKQLRHQNITVEAAKAKAAQRELNEAGRKVTTLRNRSGGAEPSGDLLSTIVQIAMLAFSVWSALDPRLRAAVRIPRALAGIGGFLQ